MPTTNSTLVADSARSLIPRSGRIRLPQLEFRARFRARYPARFGITLYGRVRVSLGVYAQARLRIGP